KHAMDFGAEFVIAEIENVDFSGEVKLMYTSRGIYKSRAIIIATGASPRKIGFAGEKEYTGRGIAYCATCDGEFFSGLDIFVLGGGFAAAEEAIFLTRYGRSVTIVVREDDFTCAQMVADKVREHKDIEVWLNTEVKEVSGDDFLKKAEFFNNKTGATFTYESKDGKPFGMFVFAGYEPATDIFKGHVAIDKEGYIPTNDHMETDIPGVYAAGDLRPKDLRQIVTAVADGAIAATVAEKYVASERERLGLAAPEPKEIKAPAPEVEAPQAPAGKSDGFIPQEMKAQLKGIFDKLERTARVVTIIDPENPKTYEMQGFLKEIAELSSRIDISTYQKGENPEVEAAMALDRLPTAALFEGDHYTGVKFTGIPGGHEMNSFVLAVYNLAGPGQSMDEGLKKRIQSIEHPVKVQICISLSCHFCPDVVAACQRAALLNPNIQAEMIDSSLFPELKEQYKLMSVPAMILNDKDVVFGAKKMSEIVEILEQKH
ncbi:MAG: FAD-dependent oxidoreductase, partial [Eubacterium sp.]